MARRRIGQERLAVGSSAPRRSTSLDEISILVNWTELDGLLTGISASVKGEPGWPPLALLRALLFARWHDLSDVRLAEAPGFGKPGVIYDSQSVGARAYKLLADEFLQNNGIRSYEVAPSYAKVTEGGAEKMETTAAGGALAKAGV